MNIDVAQMESFDNPGAMVGTVECLRTTARKCGSGGVNSMFANVLERFKTFSNVRKLCSAGVNRPLHISKIQITIHSRTFLLQ